VRRAGTHRCQNVPKVPEKPPPGTKHTLFVPSMGAAGTLERQNVPKVPEKPPPGTIHTLFVPSMGAAGTHRCQNVPTVPEKPPPGTKSRYSNKKKAGITPALIIFPPGRHKHLPPASYLNDAPCLSWNALSSFAITASTALSFKVFSRSWRTKLIAYCFLP